MGTSVSKRTFFQVAEEKKAEFSGWGVTVN